MPCTNARQALSASRRMQQLYDRYDLLNEACFNLRWAMDALARCRRDPCADALETLSQIAADVRRDRDQVQSQLSVLEARERRNLCLGHEVSL